MLSKNYFEHKTLSLLQTFSRDMYPVSMSPTFGMPSRDTHFLRDDSASEDRYLQTSFVNQPKVVYDDEMEDTGKKLQYYL